VPSRARRQFANAWDLGRTLYGRPSRREAVARLLLAGVVLLATAATAFAQADPRRASNFWTAPWARSAATTRQTPHPAVARIIVPERDGTSLGSGTLVDVTGDYGLVITNWHVVSDASGVISVVFPDGFRTAAQLIKVDRTWDLAALAVWKPNATPVPLASVPPRPGDPLTIAGYGSGDYRAAAGRCTQYVAPDMNQPYEMVEVGTAARQGDSGGPILNARGELAGVLFGAGQGTTSGSYCGRVREFLASVLPGSDTAADNAMIAARESQRPQRLSAIVPRDRMPGDRPATPGPAAALGNSRSLGGSHDSGRSARERIAAHSAAQAPPESRADDLAAREAGAAQTPAGDSPFGQIKTFLAVVGGAAFVLHALKFLGPRPHAADDAVDTSKPTSGRGKSK
jgi:serine protease Do